MRKLRSRGRRLVLWFAMLAVILYAGCGIVTTGDKEQQEMMDQAIAYAASAAAEQAAGKEASQEAGGFVEMPSVSQEGESVGTSSESAGDGFVEAPSESAGDGFVEVPSVAAGDGFVEMPSVTTEEESGQPPIALPETGLVELLDEDGSYTTCEDVALYLEIYEKLPGNFITKQEARALGWEGGSLESYAPGKCIGGDKFGNYEGLLPEADGRSYKECDIDTLGADSRGAKRIVYSNDGLIYYTEDHYASFTLLYN